MKFSTISTHVTVGDLFNPIEPPGLYQCNGRKKRVKLGIVAHINKPNSGGAEVGGPHCKFGAK